MDNRRKLGFWVVTVALAGCTSGCFATRVVRDDTLTSYQLLREQAPEESGANALAAPLPTTSAPEGTLVVEALAAPPVAPSIPVRLPDEVAQAATPPRPTHAPAPAWDPLPSYVARYATTGWAHLPLFSGSGSSTQPSTSFRGWAPMPTVAVPPGYVSSPHFSSPPSFSGTLSSHFAGGYPGPRR